MGVGLHRDHFPYKLHMVSSGSDVGGWDNVLYISSPTAFKYSLASDSWLLGLPKVPKRLELKPGLTCLHAWMWFMVAFFDICTGQTYTLDVTVLFFGTRI